MIRTIYILIDWVDFSVSSSRIRYIVDSPIGPAAPVIME